jgi:hypothetical protein
MSDFEQGTLIRSTATFTNAAGANTDPTTVTVRYRVGTDTVTTKVYVTDAAVIKSATGIFYIDLAVGALDGTWHVRWEGTGAVVAAVEASFSVKPSQFD